MKTLKLFLPVLIVLGMISCSQQTENSAEVKPPSNLISYEKAFEQLNNFNSAHPDVSGDEYALRVWVSIEDLENYINYVKSEGKRSGIEVNGMEFIYTQYQNSKPNMPNESNKDYELTLMYAPTFKDSESGKNEAFDPMNSEENKIVKLRDVFAKKEVGDSINSDSENKAKEQSSPNGKSGIANSLNACPPICP